MQIFADCFSKNYHEFDLDFLLSDLIFFFLRIRSSWLMIFYFLLKLDYFSPSYPLALKFLVGEPELNIWLCVLCVCVMCVSCVCVRCPLDRCVALIGQLDNCMNRPGLLAWASTLHGFPTMAILWPAFLFHIWSFNIFILYIPLNCKVS